jgi:hypothetical protein
MTHRRRALLWLAIATILAPSPRAARAQGAALRQRWHPGDEPPDVEGIHLGDTRERVLAVLGAPDPSPIPDDPAADFSTLSYRGGALLIALGKADGVQRIMLRRAEGGRLAGIGVGDHLGKLLIGWGEPTQSHGSLGRYVMGAWTITVRADFGAQKVLRLMLARTPAQPVTPPPAPPADTAPAAPQPAP